MLKTLAAVVSIISLSILSIAAATIPAAAQPLRGANSCGGSVNTAPSQSQAGIAAAIVCLINAERAGAGLPAVTLVNQLGTAAQGHANAAASIKWWTGGADSHVNPQTRSTPSSRISAAGYCPGGATRTSEITYTGYGTGATGLSAVNWWVNVSTFGHRANVLDRNVTHIGVGVAGPSADPAAGSNAQQGTYVVNFGACPSMAGQTPAPAPTPPAAGGRGEFSAFATNWRGNWGYGVHQASEQQARTLAVNGCSASGCEIFWTTRDQCVAYAESRTGGFWLAAGGGTSRQQAEANAIRFCQSGTAPANSCAIRLSQCR